MAEAKRRVVNISTATFVRLGIAAALVWVWLRIWQWALVFIVAVFLAIALDPIVEWLERRRVPRAIGAPLVALVLAGLIVWFVYLAGASLVDQARTLASRIGDVQREIGDRVPSYILRALPETSGSDSRLANYAVAAGRAAMSAVLSLAVGLILTVYLLVDGRRTYEWLAAFASPAQRPRVHHTALEARRKILAYVRGNVITSILATVFTFIVLVALKVPAALLLAVLSGVLDFVPVIGFILSIVPAVLLAMTVSPTVAITVALFYIAYNAVENYFIAPKVYGHELRLSDLAVLVAFAIGAELGGVVGAVIVLPLAALYPVIEDVWLRGRLDPAVPEDHRRIERTQER